MAQSLSQNTEGFNTVPDNRISSMKQENRGIARDTLESRGNSRIPYWSIRVFRRWRQSFICPEIQVQLTVITGIAVFSLLFCLLDP